MQLINAVGHEQYFDRFQLARGVANTGQLARQSDRSRWLPGEGALDLTTFAVSVDPTIPIAITRQNRLSQVYASKVVVATVPKHFFEAPIAVDDIRIRVGYDEGDLATVSKQLR
jgi:hypothetical protein